MEGPWPEPPVPLEMSLSEREEGSSVLQLPPPDICCPKPGQGTAQPLLSLQITIHTRTFLNSTPTLQIHKQPTLSLPFPVRKRRRKSFLAPSTREQLIAAAMGRAICIMKRGRDV